MLAVALVGAPTACRGEPPPLGGGTTEDTSTGSSSSSSAAPDSSGGTTQTPACADYLACLAGVEPERLPEAEAEYGPAGSCWSDSATAAACDAMCIDELEARCPVETGGGTGEELLTCSIEALAPGFDSPVVAGDGAEVLPPSIGLVLENNCGCHYLDPEQVDPEVPTYFGAMPMATWQDFHSTFMGTVVHERVRQRAVVELSMPPPFYCDALDFGSLSAEDYALLGAWLEASAPDAAAWDGG
ncbi:hypothetical protein [Paraliomyxa miuraensis]|uniref:hypothetical protein n=1 Tax=Paraliomyxa miuraensis TaxID=376150 RepID=UPI0022557E5E|nr:hypothetical protein [Paraliomyxa miuraensis]MCX4247223.1 hypothetical protein [Paraliomyxa miuraensis]